MIKRISPRMAIKMLRFWPPYLASGISVKSCNEDLSEIVVKMHQRFTNTNYVGSHFGGSLYSMCDPFFMFMLLEKLREDHIVWDKGAKIEFVRPGKGTVTAKFVVCDEDVDKIKQEALESFSINPVFKTEVVDKAGEVVAKVEKTLYVRRKDAKERFSK